MRNSEYLYHEERKAGRNVLIGAGLLGLAVLLLVVGFFHFGDAKKHAEHLNDVILSEGEKTGKIAYVDVDGFFQFASYGDDLGYYIAYDEDFFYIVTILEKDFDHFAGQFDENSDEMVRLWGYTQEIPSEAKSYAVEGMNEEFEKEVMTMSDFTDVFGDIMLEVRRTFYVTGIGGYMKTAWLESCLSVVLFLIGAVLFFGGRSSKKSYDSFLDADNRDASWFLEEADDPESVLDEKGKMIFGPQSLILYNEKPEGIEYEDILWVYVTQHRTNGIPDFSFLNICLKDGRRLSSGNRRTAGKKNREAAEEEHNEAIARIQKRNPELLIGYTEKNEEVYQERVHGEI